MDVKTTGAQSGIIEQHVERIVYSPFVQSKHGQYTTTKALSLPSLQTLSGIHRSDIVRSQPSNPPLRGSWSPSRSSSSLSHNGASRLSTRTTSATSMSASETTLTRLWRRSGRLASI